MLLLLRAAVVAAGAAAAVGDGGEGAPALRGDVQLLQRVAHGALLQAQLLLLHRRRRLRPPEQAHQTPGRWRHQPNFFSGAVETDHSKCCNVEGGGLG